MRRRFVGETTSGIAAALVAEVLLRLLDVGGPWHWPILLAAVVLAVIVAWSLRTRSEARRGRQSSSQVASGIRLGRGDLRIEDLIVRSSGLPGSVASNIRVDSGNVTIAGINLGDAHGAAADDQYPDSTPSTGPEPGDKA